MQGSSKALSIGMGGHRGLGMQGGLICTAKIQFLWRNYKKWSHTPSSSPPLAMYHNTNPAMTIIMVHHSKFGGSAPSYVTSAIRMIKFYQTNSQFFGNGHKR